MICKACRTGADIKNKDLLAKLAKEGWHKNCEGGTWCDCQHRVGRKNVL